jgi:hypothetical protein
VEKATQQEALCSVLLTKYYSDDQIKKTEVGRTCSRHRELVKCMQVLVRRHEETRPFEMPKCKWDDDIKNNLQEIG